MTIKENKIKSEALTRDDVHDPIVSENALKVLQERYLAKDDQGKIIEDPKDMYLRVANAVASAEPKNKKFWARKFYNIMADNSFLPNSPTLMNAGRRLGMLSACFVLPVEDDLDQIFTSVKSTALVQRAGGGTGFDFSNLRPSGSIVKSSGGTTAGPLSFIDVFSQATNTIQQGAFRRGANMGIMRIDHPDIIAFIKAKTDLNRWQNYNVSIAMTNAWMRTLKSNPNAQHSVFHKEWGIGYLCKNKDTLEVKAFRTADHELGIPGDTFGNEWLSWTYQDTWDLICQRAWNTGEPGLFFIDKANENNPVAHLGRITATNPCGEQPLHAYDSCNLGSINLGKFIQADNKFDFDTFRVVIDIAVRFLDNIISINKYPIPEIEEMSKKTRRIGLGVMGWADYLFKKNIPYDSSKATIDARTISKVLMEQATIASAQLASEKGPYLAIKPDTKRPTRNAFICTVAPTGTISIIADCSGGIEPIFALAFKRTVMPDANGKFKEMYEVNKVFEKALSDTDDISISKGDKKRILDHIYDHGSLAGLNVNDSLPRAIEDLKRVFVTSHEITPESHVNMQAAWQANIDTAISKTINLAHDAPVSEVSKAYNLAFTLGCKGITVYRDGCRNNVAGMKQPMSVEKKEKTPWEEFGLTKEEYERRSVLLQDARQQLKDTFPDLDALPTKPSQPIVETKQLQLFTDVLPSYRTQIKTQFGNLHVHIVLDQSGTRETEIFAQLGKAGDLIAADLEAICRLASMALKKGSTIQEVIEQIEGIGTTHIMPSADGKIVSMPDALAKALRKYLNSGLMQLRNSKPIGTIKPTENKPTVSKVKDRNESNYGVKCPQCPSGKISFQEGCEKCHSCGYSAC